MERPDPGSGRLGQQMMGMRMRLPRARRPDQVSALLAAACAPARPGELAGEEAAVAAYRAAGDAPPSSASSRSGRSRRLSVGLTAWLAAVAATAAAAGATFAAVNDETPPSRPETQRITTPAGAGTTGATPDRTPATTTGGPARSGGGPGTASSAPGRSGNTASLVGLCRAYLAQNPANRAKLPRTSAFRRLVEAAGGAGQVTGYCEKAVAGAAGPAKGRSGGATPKPGGPPPASPARTGPPRGKPSGEPGNG